MSGINEMDQLIENLLIVENSVPGMLSREELETYKDVEKILNESNKIPCTGCFSVYNTFSSISKSQEWSQFSMSTLPSGRPEEVQSIAIENFRFKVMRFRCGFFKKKK